MQGVDILPFSLAAKGEDSRIFLSFFFFVFSWRRTILFTFPPLSLSEKRIAFLSGGIDPPPPPYGRSNSSFSPSSSIASRAAGGFFPSLSTGEKGEASGEQGSRVPLFFLLENRILLSPLRGRSLPLPSSRIDLSMPSEGVFSRRVWTRRPLLSFVRPSHNTIVFSLPPLLSRWKGAPLREGRW